MNHFNRSQMEVIADVLEAVSNVRKWSRFYQAVLHHTGDKDQARKALLFVMRMEEEVIDHEYRKAA